MSEWHKGFTLMEILISLIIISLLVSVATIMYSTQINKTRDRDLETKAEMLRTAIMQYYRDQLRYPASLSARATHTVVINLQPLETEEVEFVPFLPRYFQEDKRFTDRINAYTYVRLNLMHKLELSKSELNTVTVISKFTPIQRPQEDKGGWLYNSDTGRLWVNITSSDSGKTPYSDY